MEKTLAKLLQGFSQQVTLGAATTWIMSTGDMGIEVKKTSTFQ